VCAKAETEALEKPQD